MTNIVDKNEEAVRKALPELKIPRVEKSFAPPEQRGIHELVERLEEVIDLAQGNIKILKMRLREFETTAAQLLGKSNDA